MAGTRLLKAFGVAVVIASASSESLLSAQTTKAAMERDPACRSLLPAATGGPAPRGPDTVVVRWLSANNYEVAYREHVFLLDSYFDQTPRRHSPGVAVRDFKKATAIFIGHAHFDHIADAPVIARQTRATVVGGIGVLDYVRTAGLPATQFRLATSGEVLRYPGVSVQAVQGTHASPEVLQIPDGHDSRQNSAISGAGLQQPLTEAEKARDAAVRARGSSNPRVATEGVINYLFTFGNGFRLLFADSNGGITEAQGRITPDIDVGLFPWRYFDAGIPALVKLVTLTRPSTVFLGGHDGVGTVGWASNDPAALAIRDASPKTRTMDVPYRTPVCFDTTSKEMAIGW